MSTPSPFIKVPSGGPRNANVMLVGEAPGAHEAAKGVPFIGPSGEDLNRMLHEAGFLRTECFVTNVCKYRPPGNDIDAFFLDSKQLRPNEMIVEGLAELKAEIEEVQPKLIIALGKTALWGLTGKRGITKWRGSQLDYNGIPLIPTYHPALIQYEWSWRAIAVHDLKRAKKVLEEGQNKPTYNFIVRPSYVQCLDTLEQLIQRATNDSNRGPFPLAVDLETRSGHIACVGLAWNRTDAICIPAMCVERPLGYWTAEEDLAIWLKLRGLLEHPNVEVIGQNFLYDAQYFSRRWGYVPRLRHDTMFMQHVMFAGMPKSLDFLASMYCEYYVYWKDEGKTWDPRTPEEQLWVYNCLDAVATWEITTKLLPALRSANLDEQYNFQMRLWWPVLRMMLRGIGVDAKRRGVVAEELFSALQTRELALREIVGHDINIRSPKQMKELFYGELQQKVVKAKKTFQPTTNDAALETIAIREPLLRPMTKMIREMRSIGVFISNFIKAQLDPDGRMRCSFNPAGTETYRFSSSTSAFDTGTNLQTIPEGNEDE